MNLHQNAIRLAITSTMRYHRFSPPVIPADFERLCEHWRSLGWERIPPSDEDAIEAAWNANLQRGREMVFPSPSRTWDVRAIYPLGKPMEPSEEVESELTLKVLAAFRRCVAKGTRLLAIDWQHQWYYFDPHAGITTASLDEWAMPILPDGDSRHFIAEDFMFGVSGDWRGYLTLFGSRMLDAWALDPSDKFLRVCKIVETSDWQA